MTRKQLVATIVVFLLICACGVLTMLAGGVRWGTPDCGFGVAMTFFLGLAIAPMAGGLAE